MDHAMIKGRDSRSVDCGMIFSIPKEETSIVKENPGLGHGGEVITRKFLFRSPHQTAAAVTGRWRRTRSSSNRLGVATFCRSM